MENRLLSGQWGWDAGTSCVTWANCSTRGPWSWVGSKAPYQVAQHPAALRVLLRLLIQDPGLGSRAHPLHCLGRSEPKTEEEMGHRAQLLPFC